MTKFLYTVYGTRCVNPGASWLPGLTAIKSIDPSVETNLQVSILY